METEFIPPKKSTKVVPKDLQDKMGAIEACATAFNLIDKGHFTHAYHNHVKAALAFLMKLHETCLEEALKHPQAHMIDALKDLMKEKKAEKDGKETTDQSTDSGLSSSTDS